MLSPRMPSPLLNQLAETGINLWTVCSLPCLQYEPFKFTVERNEGAPECILYHLFVKDALTDSYSKEFAEVSYANCAAEDLRSGLTIIGWHFICARQLMYRSAQFLVPLIVLDDCECLELDPPHIMSPNQEYDLSKKYDYKEKQGNQKSIKYFVD